MKSIRESISRILEKDRATDMEAVLFILRQMDLLADLQNGAPASYDTPIVSIARELLDDLENPFARKLLGERVDEYSRKRTGGTGPSGKRAS